MSIITKLINEVTVQHRFNAILEKAQNEEEVDKAIEKIEFEISSKTEDDQKGIWESLYKYLTKQDDITPANESLDNQHFYKLIAYKKQQIKTKKLGKK